MSESRDNLAEAVSSQPTELPGEWRWLGRVLDRLGQLGLTSRLFDADGRVIHAGIPAGPFSALVCQGADGACDVASSVRSFLDGTDRREAVSMLPGWICLMAPIQRRRRRVGVVASLVVCRDLADGEELARFCQGRQLDRVAVARAARQEARFDSAQAESLVRVIRLLLDQAQEEHVARAELGEMSQNLTSTYEELSLVYRMAAGMTVTEKPEDYVRGIGAELLEVMNVESLAIRYFRPDQPLVSKHLSMGDELTAPSAEQALWDELLDRFDSGPGAIVNNRASAERGAGLGSLAHQTRVRQVAAVPMVRNGQLVGAILAMNKRSGEFDSVDVKLMKSIADGTAVFLENAFLYEDLQQLLMGMLRALTSSVDAKDPYTCGHSERVAVIASRLAASAGLDEYAVARVYLSGLLHDIGKIGVPEAVLTKPGRLTKVEFAIMRKHPEIGARILSGIKQVQDLVAGVLYHHERMDGKGYPHGLAGERIPIFGRIVGLADCFDAMTSNRTYRPALPLEVTLTEIRRFAGTQFDPEIVEAFLRLDPGELLQQLRSTNPSEAAEGLTRQSGPLAGLELTRPAGRTVSLGGSGASP